MSTATKLDGKKVAAEVLANCAARVEQIKQRSGVQPCLATVLVGHDPSSEVYVKMKGRRCDAAGMRSLRVDLPEETTTEQLINKLTELGNDESIHGILLQHPAPAHVDERAAFEAIPSIKDVDGVTIQSWGGVSFDLPNHGYGSCTPAGIMRLLHAYDLPIKGRHAVVVGRSPILGKPMAMMLLAAHATVTICHSRTEQLADVVRLGDIVVAAVGKPEFVRGDWIKPGAVVIDAGYNPGDVGDVHYPSAAEQASYITPVPGGVGPMTVATLIDQTATGCARQLGLDGI